MENVTLNSAPAQDDSLSLSLNHSKSFISVSSSSLGDAEMNTSGNFSLMSELQSEEQFMIINKALTLVQLNRLITMLPRSLTHLTLDGCSLTDESLKGFGKLGGLEKLSLQRNQLNGEGIPHLRNLVAEGLLELFLDHNQIADKGILCLSSILMEGSRLESLYLDSNLITSKGASGLSSLIRGSSLMILSLNGCKIANEGALKIFSATQAPVSSLLVLNMDSCKLDDNFLPRLGAMFGSKGNKTSLVRIRMRQNRFKLDESVLEGMLARMLQTEDFIDVSNQVMTDSENHQ